MRCQACEQEPCTCQKALALPAKKLLWLIQECQTPGCNVTIRSPIDAPLAAPRCRWCQQGGAYMADQIQGRAGDGPPMSKDEFGVDLFAAIQAQAGLRQAEKTAVIFQKKGLKRQEREALDSVKALQHELTVILGRNTIAPYDVKRLLAIT